MFNPRQQEQMMQALSAFVNADNWLESKRIVQQAQALLLTDEAEMALLALMAQHADDDQMVDMLVEHSVLLKACRDHGIETAFAVKMRPTAQTGVMKQIEALLECDSSRAVLELAAEQPILLTDEVEQMLQESINNSRAQGTPQGEAMAEHVEARLASLRQVRQMMAKSEMTAQEILQGARMMDKMPDKQAMLVEPLQAFVTSDHWLAAREVVEEHPELLSAEADALLAQWVAEAEAQGDAEAVQHFQLFRERLARARQEGLDAIVPPMSAEKLSMMEELAALPEDVRNLFLSLVQNTSSAEELQAALEKHPELLPVLSQVMGQSDGNNNSNSNVPPELAPYVQRAVVARDRLRMERTDSAMNEAVAAWQTLLERPQLAEYPDFAIRVQVELADTYLRRYQAWRQASDLDEAITLYREVVQHTPARSPDRSGFLNNLATALSDRFSLRGQASDLDQAIELYREALQHTPPGSPNRPSILNNLEIALKDKGPL